MRPTESYVPGGTAFPFPWNGSPNIVEQSRLKTTRSGFVSEQIHNAENLQDVPAELNQIKANYCYSSKDFFTNGLTVRDWLNGQSFEDQWNFGMQVTEDIRNGVRT